MCKTCEERAKHGALSLIDSCADKQGLPYNAVCEFCKMPVHQFARKDKTMSIRNRFGEMHSRTCAAIYSRVEKGRVMSTPHSPRVHGYRPEDEK